MAFTKSCHQHQGDGFTERYFCYRKATSYLRECYERQLNAYNIPPKTPYDLRIVAVAKEYRPDFWVPGELPHSQIPPSQLLLYRCMRPRNEYHQILPRQPGVLPRSKGDNKQHCEGAKRNNKEGKYII